MTAIRQQFGSLPLHRLQVLFIGLVLIPGLNVTLNFLASPVMARDLKLGLYRLRRVILWPPVLVEGDQLCWCYTSKTWVPKDTSRDSYMPRGAMALYYKYI
jgi:hypothetical protein